MTRLAYLAGAAALAAALGLAGNAFADTFVVAGDNVDCVAGGAADATTIQGGIGAASAGDTVAVCPGTYSEDLEIFGLDGLTLIATDRADNTTTVIQGVADSGGATFPFAVPNIDLQSHGVTITGFTIRSPAAVVGEYASGLIIDGTDNKIYNNKFEVSCGTPGSVAIQTWALANGSQGLGDISGLTIALNTFRSLFPNASGCLGYEGVFINPQSAVNEEDPVVVSGNNFGGRLYRAVGVVRSYTDVGFNTIRTGLFTQITDDFGTVPIGIKVFDGSNSVIANNSIVGGFFFFLPRFNTGIWLTADTAGNIVKNNVVQFSATNDCLDESTDTGTAGTANIWTGNTGFNADPADICN